MTSPADRRPSWRLRVAAALVGAASRLAPAAERGDWLREWRAELDDRVALLEARGELTRRAEMDLLRRCLGGVAHALWLRRQEWTLDMLTQDLRHALRSLAARPGFALVAALTLALGIGAATTIFSVVYGVLLRPLPFREPDRLVQLWETNPTMGWTQATVAPANLKDWIARNHVFDSVAWYVGSDTKGPSLSSYTLSDEGGPEQLWGVRVSPSFFDVLGVGPALGRGFEAGEDTTGRHRVIVLSHGLWLGRFGGDPHVVGRDVRLGGEPYRVVGVMGSAFRFPSPDADFWAPLEATPGRFWERRLAHWLRVVARLKPGVTLDQARADLGAIATQLEREYPDTNTKMGAGVGPAQEWMVGDVRRPLVVLLGAVGGLLLIACANVAGLLLVRGAGRARELAVRAALGAGRVRLVRQLLSENALLAITGGAAGVTLAGWGVEAFRTMAPAGIPRVTEVRLDAPVLAFSVATTAFTVLVFGLLPALGAARGDAGALRDGGRAVTGGQRARRAFVVAEVALSVVLVVGAGLLIRSFTGLLHVDPGFDPSRVLTFQVTAPAARYPSPDRLNSFYDRVIGKLEALPGVEAAGGVTRKPLTGYRWTGDLAIEGRPELWGRELRHNDSMPGYFAAMGLPILRGRDFTAAETLNTPPVVIVNEAFATKYLPGEDPVGRRISYSRPTEKPGWTTIVGVVGNEQQDGLSVPVEPEVFDPLLQDPNRTVTLVVRAAGDPAALVSAARAVVREVDSEIAVYNVETMADSVAGSLQRERFLTTVAGIFAAMALALASVGLYGLIAFAVSARTREIGLRMALGAQRRSVLGLVLGDGLRLAVVGLGIGLVAAAALTRGFATLLYGTTATDPATYLGVATLFVLVAVVAVAVPARRASRVDPLVALRTE